MRQLGRLIFIIVTVLRFGLDEVALSAFPQRWVRALVRIVTIGRKLDAPRGERLRQGLERLGPIFVKFGQVLSTRRDLIPLDVADELARLQDRVPPFPAAQSRALVEKAFGRPIDAIFASFDAEPVASASIAQVHFAVLKDGREVAVKVLRPGMLDVIDHDMALLHLLARWVERLSVDGKRLKPREVVAEFDGYLHDELDLVREAANAAHLRRNMAGLNLVLVPEMVWELCTPSVIVMQRMHGVPISQVARLREAGVDFKKLARDGVTLFFTQVFRDGFFHADMHPGNIMVSLDPRSFGRYIALDFGIVGTLTDTDKEYLAYNFIAFFRREGDLARPGADAAVPDLAPLQRGDPAAAGAAAKDAAQYRGPGARARPGAGPVGHRQALPGALDERTDRLARHDRAHEERGAALCAAAAGAAAAAAPVAAAGCAAARVAGTAGLAGRATPHQPAAAGGAVGGAGLRGRAGAHAGRVALVGVMWG